jgi:hypothetical protein
MLRACVLAYGKCWEYNLAFAEFSYNNGYHASLKKAPFEVLYGRKCRTPLMWSEVGDPVIESPDFINAIEEKIAEVRENLRIAQSCQKSYADKRRRELKFDVEDHVYLKVPWFAGPIDFECVENWTPPIHWSIPHHQEDMCCGLQAEATKATGRRAWHLHIYQLRKCLRVPESSAGYSRLARWSAISRGTREDSRHHDKKNPNESFQPLQGTMESTLWSWSDVGERRCPKRGVSPSIRKALWISRARFNLSEVGL